MPKPKKDWTALNIRMNSGIYDALAQYADDKGQNKTVAVERILKEYLEKEGYEEINSPRKVLKTSIRNKFNKR